MINPTRVISFRALMQRFSRCPPRRSGAGFLFAAIFAYFGTQVAVAGCASEKNKPGESEPIGALLSIEGDVEYGEYLSGECVTCHLSENLTNEIPSIVGREPADFMMALNAYRVGERTHPMMQMVAKKLDDEAIAALAAYFAEVKQ